MSIFRVEKNTNYTVISNYHLRDRNLSLKTIGLLSLILSLPDNWDYSQAGLASICKDGEDSIRSGLKELEKYGYLERERERDENGRMKGIIYKVYEIPKNQREVIKPTSVGPYDDTSRKASSHTGTPKKTSPTSDLPKRENPMLVNPTLSLPTQVSPTQEGEGQIIKDKTNKDLINKDLINTHPSIYRSDRQTDGFQQNDQRTALKNTIKENVNYEFFEFKRKSIEERFTNGSISMDEYDNATLTYDTRTLDKIIDYMLDILTSLNDDPVKIGNEVIDRSTVKSKMMTISMMDMKRVIFELNANPSIKNPKKYAISMLYNL